MSFEFTYNARSQMTKVKDALNQEYTFTYDPRGHVLSQTRNSSTMSYGYDNAYNRTSRTDYNGNVTTYSYDDLNRLTAIAYTGSSDYASYTYDDLSRLLSAENQNGTVEFTYNNRGLLASETDVFSHLLEYSYDPVGNRTGFDLDSITQTAYAYDNADRLTTLTDEVSNNFTFVYDAANRLTSRAMPNGITSTFTYDGMSRLTRLKHENTSTTLYDDQYSYNSANQISQIAGLSATKNYTYDNINRLTGMTDGTNTESYSYDAVGNRTASHLSSSYTTGSFNRLTATDTASYSYNSNGSLTGKTVGSTSWTYGWDRENRLVSASDGTNSVAYAFDALGRRIKRTQGLDIQKYTHDGSDVVLDDINTAITKYQNGPGIDDKLKSVTGSTPKYFLQDHLGSSVVITNSGGSSTDTNSYDSFGAGTNGSFSNRYRYTGREADALTGLQFSRARYFDPAIGRFLSEDPIGFAGGDANLYGYTFNNPINFTDPMGTSYSYPNDVFMDYLAGKYGTASDVADAVDRIIERVMRALGFNPPVTVVPFPLTSKPAEVVRLEDLLKGLVDPLRAGQGIGCATARPDLPDHERFNLFARDFVRGGSLFLLGASAAKPFIKPAVSLYDDSLTTGGSIRNVQTDVGSSEFMSNLQKNGFTASHSKDGAVINLEKGPTKYSVRPKSVGQKPPSVDVFNNGQRTHKIRLRR